MKKKDFYLFDIEAGYKIKLTDRAEMGSQFLSRHLYDKDKDGNITALNLDNSNISTLDLLKPLTKLHTLSLRNNKIADLSALSLLRNLQTLDIAENLVEDLSPLRLLKKLSSLNLEKNNIYDLTPIYLSLKSGNLNALVCASNPLQFPEPAAARRGIVSIVSWFDENIRQANKKVAANFRAKDSVLDLGRCGLTNLSFIPDLKKCKHLEKLILSNEWGEYENGQWERKVSANEGPRNNIVSFPKELNELKNLKVLICGGDWKSQKQKRWNRWRISNIHGIGDFLNLEQLNLSNNQIEGAIVLPHLPKLKHLHLNNNRITSLRVRKKNSALRDFNVSNNELTDISVLNSFPAIETADFHSNQISDLASIVPCLARLPVEDAKWKKGVIAVAGNPMKNPDMTIVTQGTRSVLAWLKRSQSERSVGVQAVNGRDIKLILVGNPSVGKSTLVKYLQTEKVVRGLASTHWMDVEQWSPTKGGKAYNVRIFDFGGQEYYHDAHHLFFTQRTAYILMWDQFTDQFGEIMDEPRQRQPFSEAETYPGYPLKYWLESIKYHMSRRATSFDEQRVLSILREKDREEMGTQTEASTPAKLEVDPGGQTIELFRRDPLVLLAQNKVDQPGSAFLLNADSIAGNEDIIFDSISISLHKERGLQHLKEILFEQFDSILELDRETPATWDAVKERIIALQKGEAPELTLSAFRTFCNETISETSLAKQLRPKEVDTLFFTEEETFLFAQYLSNIGILLFFPNVEGLQDRVFLNQNKIRKNIYDILLDLEKKNGEFTTEYAAGRLKKRATDEECFALLNLMTDFKIVFPHPTIADTYIAPLYLPQYPPAAVGLFLKSFKKPFYRFSFTGYIHKHLVLEFFNKYGKDLLKGEALTDTAYYWRDGLLLSDPSSLEIVLVKFVSASQTNPSAYIDLFGFQGNPGNFFLDRIADGLESMTQYMDAKKEVTLDGENFVPIFELEKAKKEMSWMFRCRGRNYELVEFKKYVKLPGLMKKIFISYSKSDTEYLIKLEKHLTVLKRNGTISTWNCRKLDAGDVWDEKIKSELEEADIIIFLVSDDFLATEYIWEVEIKRAVERQSDNPNGVRVIPIIVRECFWEESPIGKFNTAPGKAKVIASSGDIDKAFKEAVMAIKGVVE